MTIPTDLTGLTGWYRADDLALADNDSVTSWADASGNGRTLTQANATFQPVYKTAQIHDHPIVRFDGDDDFMATPAWASPTTGVTVMAMVMPDRSTDTWRHIYVHAADVDWVDGQPLARVALRHQPTSQFGDWYAFAETGMDGDWHTQTYEPITLKYQLVEFIYNQTELRLWRNKSIASAQPQEALMTSSTFPVYIGSNTTGNYNFSGDICEIVAYDRGLLTVERQDIEDYLWTRWFMDSPPNRMRRWT